MQKANKNPSAPAAPSAHPSSERLLGASVVIALAEAIPFLPTYSLMVPETGGIYLIHDLRGTLYVGRSINLRRRFGEHFWLTENQLLAQARRTAFGSVQYSWQCVDDLDEQIALESQLINWLCPVCNRLTPKLPKSSNH